MRYIVYLYIYMYFIYAPQTDGIIEKKAMCIYNINNYIICIRSAKSAGKKMYINNKNGCSGHD